MGNAHPMDFPGPRTCYVGTSSMVDILNPPKIQIHYIDDVDGPPFLHLRHVKMKLEYPNGEFSEEFVYDIVECGKPDAVVIVPYEMRYDDLYSDQVLCIWLRSCVRPAVGARFEFPNSKGSGWELPAGLIDPGELPKGNSHSRTSRRSRFRG
jgi:hypothetical protein